MGKTWKLSDFIFLGSKINANTDCSHEIKRYLILWKKSYDKTRQHIKKHFADKGSYSQSYGLSSSHVWMWELDHKKGRVLKNWCFWSVVLEKTLESPLESNEIKQANLKGSQPWMLFGRTDFEAEAPIVWSPDANSWSIGKDPATGKD